MNDFCPVGDWVAGKPTLATGSNRCIAVITSETLMDTTTTCHDPVTAQSVQNRPYTVSLKTPVHKLALLSFEHPA